MVIEHRSQQGRARLLASAAIRSLAQIRRPKRRRAQHFDHLSPPSVGRTQSRVSLPLIA